MGNDLSINEAFFEEVLEPEMKELVEDNIDMREIINFALKYEIWELHRMETDLKEIINNVDLSKDEVEVLMQGIIKIIFHSDFPKVLKKGIEKAKSNIYADLSNKANSFSEKLKRFIKEIIEDYPKKKNHIIGLLIKENKESMDQLPKDGLEFRSLKGIEEDYDEVAMRQMLETYGSIVESRYVSYLKLLTNIFQICGLIENLNGETPGRMIFAIKNVFNEYYSKYEELVDIWEITIRNSNAHNDFKFKNDNKILIYNTDRKTGKRKHKKILSKEDLSTRLSYLIERFVPIGALHIAILDIIIKIFLFGEKNYFNKLIKKMKNDPKIKKLK